MYLNPMNLFRSFSHFKIGKSKRMASRSEITKFEMHILRPQPIELQQEIKRNYIKKILTQKVMPVLKILAIDILSLLYTARMYPRNLRFLTITRLAQRSYAMTKYLFVNYKPKSIVSKAFNIADEQYAKFTKYAFNSLRKSFNEANEQATKRVSDSLKSFWRPSNSSEFEKLFAEQDLTKCKTATELQALKERVKKESADRAAMQADMKIEEYGYILSLLITPFYMLKNLVVSPTPAPQIAQPVLVGRLTKVPAPVKTDYESLSNKDKFILFSRPADKIIATEAQQNNARKLKRSTFGSGMR